MALHSLGGAVRLTDQFKVHPWPNGGHLIVRLMAFKKTEPGVG
jgi:hypothetical protein